MGVQTLAHSASATATTTITTMANNKRSAEQMNNSSTSSPGSRKKKRVKWTQELHELFLEALSKLGDKAVPSTLLSEMGVTGLTRENVASHLQKYRTQLREGGSPYEESNDHLQLPARYQRSSGSFSNSFSPSVSPRSSVPATPIFRSATFHPVSSSSSPSGLATATVLALEPEYVIDNQALFEFVEEQGAHNDRNSEYCPPYRHDGSERAAYYHSAHPSSHHPYVAYDSAYYPSEEMYPSGGPTYPQAAACEQGAAPFCCTGCKKFVA